MGPSNSFFISEKMSVRPRLNLVVAVAENGGIGLNGDLPWRLRKDMAFFKRITSEVNEPTKQNAVLMGRNTWDSIPAKFKPLANRINIVVSTSLREAPTGTYIAHSLDECFELLKKPEIASKLEEIFVIGGSQLYKSVLTSSNQNIRLYYTKVLKTFDSDVFFPSVDFTNYNLVNVAGISSEVQEENGTQFKFEVYDNKFDDDKLSHES